MLAFVMRSCSSVFAFAGKREVPVMKSKDQSVHVPLKLQSSWDCSFTLFPRMPSVRSVPSGGLWPKTVSVWLKLTSSSKASAAETGLNFSLSSVTGSCGSIWRFHCSGCEEVLVRSFFFSLNMQITLRFLLTV